MVERPKLSFMSSNIVLAGYESMTLPVSIAKFLEERSDGLLAIRWFPRAIHPYQVRVRMECP